MLAEVGAGPLLRCLNWHRGTMLAPDVSTLGALRARGLMPCLGGGCRTVVAVP